jgi:hypothetical protein
VTHTLNTGSVHTLNLYTHWISTCFNALAIHRTPSLVIALLRRSNSSSMHFAAVADSLAVNGGECRSGECRSDECRSAECRSAECCTSAVLWLYYGKHAYSMNV